MSRERLLAALDEGLRLGRKLTLVSAPAGYGKTTLVASWYNHRRNTGHPLHLAWLSLDAEDNDPTRFLNYLIAAVETVRPQVGQKARIALQTGHDLPHQDALTPLVNDLATLSRHLVLVLDDYHLIESPTVHEALRFLLAHGPPTFHLLLTTRRDPPLPLGSLRGRGDLVGRALCSHRSKKDRGLLHHGLS